MLGNRFVFTKSVTENVNHRVHTPSDVYPLLIFIRLVFFTEWRRQYNLCRVIPKVLFRWFAATTHSTCKTKRRAGRVCGVLTSSKRETKGLCSVSSRVKPSERLEHLTTTESPDDDIVRWSETWVRRDVRLSNDHITCYKNSWNICVVGNATGLPIS